MQAVIQRVSSASVEVEGSVIGKIGIGIVVLLGIHHADQDSDIDFIIGKLAKARIFEDQAGKFNKTISEVQGQFLIIPQFTIYGDIKKGRPSFIEAMNPHDAEQIFLQFCAKIKAQGFQVETGKFRAYMTVNLVNEGPVTFILSSDHLKNNADIK